MPPPSLPHLHARLPALSLVVPWLRQLRVLQQLDPNHMAFIKSVLSRMAKAHIGLKDYPAALQACGQVSWACMQ
jgi:hypothetical protein